MRPLWLCLTIVLVAVICPAKQVSAQDRLAAAVGDASEPVDADAEQLRRQNTVTVGVLILVGLTSIGLLLMAAALIWGAKVRRLARHEQATPTHQDDLWDLRKGPPADDAQLDDART